MTGKLHRRFKILLAAAATALMSWIFLPGTALDEAAFDWVARSFANPPFFTAGSGSHRAPWRLRTFSSGEKPDKHQAPVIVSLGDDVEGFFQSSPPSPIDLAVVLTNFQRLGANKAATAAVLAWDAPDPMGLAALDKAISRFDSLVMAAPLSRGAVPEQMPAAFRKASVPLSAVHGDASLLPVVNRIPLPGVILGRENTSAGFQTLDSEAQTKAPPLLARWEDRVVLAFPLVVALQRLNLAPELMEIRLGEYLRLGAKGPVFPIDHFGRLSMPLPRVSPYAEIAAEALIDGGEELFPKQAPDPVILRDDRSAAEPATRTFSKRLPALVAALASDSGLASAREFPRLKAGVELLLLALLAAGLAVIGSEKSFGRGITLLAIAGTGVGAQLLAAAIGGIWLPGLPMLAAFVVAVAVSHLMPEEPLAPAVTIAAPLRPRKPPVSEPLPEPVKEEPAAPVKARPPRKKRRR